MTPEQQSALRTKLVGQCFDHIDRDVMNTVHCFVACIGAAAICAAVLPKEHRDRLIDAAMETLGPHADKRAEEMRSGEFDRQITGH
jgi:hypothetical protein